MIPDLGTWQSLVVLFDGGLLIMLGLGVRRMDPSVSPSIIFALTSWVISAGGFYALEQANAFPPAVAPLFELPVVYVTVGVLLLGTWLGALFVSTRVPSECDVGTVLGTAGAGLMGVVFLFGGYTGVVRNSLAIMWPGVIVLLAGIVTVAGWGGLLFFRPRVRATGRFGLLVVFAHALDAISTAIGIAVLGITERNPISAFIIHVTAGLPLLTLLGPAGGFVVVKLLLAGGVVLAFSPSFREDRVTGALLFEGVAAAGLAPGIHNIVLFSVT